MKKGSIVFPLACEETASALIAARVFKKCWIQSDLQTVLLVVGPNHTVGKEFQHEGGGPDLLLHGIGNEGVACAFTLFPLRYLCYFRFPSSTDTCLQGLLFDVKGSLDVLGQRVQIQLQTVHETLLNGRGEVKVLKIAIHRKGVIFHGVVDGSTAFASRMPCASRIALTSCVTLLNP